MTNLREDALHKLTTAVAGRILGGLVSDDVRRRSLDGLAGTIREAVGDAEAVRIRVSGPQSLFAALAERLGETARLLHHVEAPGIDLAIDIDGELFETRLSDWSAMLAEALA